MKSKKVMILFSTAISFTACTRSLPYPTVDIHAHAAVNGSGADAASLVAAMDSTKFSHLFLMQEPAAAESATATSMDTEISYFSGNSSKFRYFYGGNELNPIIHGIAHVGTFSVGSVYPNGAMSDTVAQQDVAALQAIQADTATYTTTFQNRANAAASSGKYVGFGEFGALHYSRKTGQPYVSFSVNHSLMKWLSDLAATNNMVLDIHLEATTESLTEFDELLAYNRNTKIIWDHAGWTSSGEGTAAKVLDMMDRNPNLYLSLKLRKPEGSEYRQGNPFDSYGKLRKPWFDLIKKYSNRIMVGTDVKIWSDDGDASKTLKMVSTFYAEFLLQLPEDVASAVSNNTAKTLFGL